MGISKKTVVFVILAFLIIAGCGYNIAGRGGSAGVTYYLASINNNSNDLTVTQEMQRYVTRFFSDYGALRSQSEAAYTLTVTLDRKAISTTNESITREATTSQLDVQYSFVVHDRNNKIVFEQSIIKRDTFATGTTSTQFNSMRTTAFQELTEDALSEFIIRFERRNVL